MAMRERRINSLFTKFMTSIQDQSIEDYFSVPGKYKLIRESDDVLSFEVDYEYMPRCKIVDFPTDIATYIASFLYKKSTCTFKIVFPPSYPFRPTEWSIVSMKSNAMDFKKAIAFQRQQYNEGWTPAISIETDILNMILQLLACL